MVDDMLPFVGLEKHCAILSRPFHSGTSTNDKSLRTPEWNEVWMSMRFYFT